MRILVDMDGILADFDKELLQRRRTRNPDKFIVPIVERKTIYLIDQYPEELRDLVQEIILEPGFFRTMVLVLG
jgi:5'(3')-deoxyribonucleotidase